MRSEKSLATQLAIAFYNFTHHVVTQHKDELSKIH